MHIEYIDSISKIFKSEQIYDIRFELGAPNENGSNERINQVNYRVRKLFNHIIDGNDEIEIYAFDYGADEDPMFGNTSPDYFYDLLEHENLVKSIYVQLDEDEDDDGRTIQLEYKTKVFSCIDKSSNIPYDKIFEGIGNYEQGREPSIGQTIYFTCPKKGIIFHMYDDRGCMIYSSNYEMLKELYHEFRDWMVDYWAEHYHELYK